MVQPLGIEPSSMALHATAITTSAKVANGASTNSAILAFVVGLGGRARIYHSWSQTTCVAINTSPSLFFDISHAHPSTGSGTKDTCYQGPMVLGVVDDCNTGSQCNHHAPKGRP